MADVAINSQTADVAAAMEQHNYFGKLIFLDMDGLPEKELAIFKNSTILGRDKLSDVYISRREVSRRHMEVSVDKDGSVSVVSLGREPVTVNGKVVVTPTELFSGDVIEIALEGRAKQIMFEGNEATVQLNHSLVMAARQPLGESNQITETAPSAGKASGRKSTPFKSRKTPRKSDGKPPTGPAFSAAFSAAPSVAGFAPPPPAPPPPAPGRLLRSQGGPPPSAASAPAVKKGPPPPPPPPPKGASLGAAISAAALKRAQSAANQQPAVAAQNPVKQPVPAPAAGGQLLPSASDLQALRAGLRKTRRQSGAEQQQEVSMGSEMEGVPSSPAAKRQSVGKGRSKSATPAAKQSIGKRKSVRFNLPAPAPSSPEGIVADATCSLVTIPEHTDAINIDADNTHAFSAWAMGSAAAANATTVLPDFPALHMDQGEDGALSEGEDLPEATGPEQVVTKADQQILSSSTEGITMGVSSKDKQQGDEAEYMDTEEIAPAAADSSGGAEQGALADPAEGDSTLPAADFAAAVVEAAAPVQGVAPGPAHPENLQSGEVQDTEKAASSTPDGSLVLELLEGSPIDSGSAGDVQMESTPEEEGSGSEAANRADKAALVLQLQKANKRARVYFTKAKLHEAAIDRLSKANLLLRRQVSSLKAQLQPAPEEPPAEQPPSAPAAHTAPLPPAAESPEQLDVHVIVVGRTGVSPGSASLHRCGSVTLVGNTGAAEGLAGKAGTDHASIPRPVFTFAGRQVVYQQGPSFAYGEAAPDAQPDQKGAGVDEMELDSMVEVPEEEVTHSSTSGWDLAFLAENKAASQKSTEAVQAMLDETAREQAPSEDAQQPQQAASQPVVCGWDMTFLQQNKEASQKSTEAVQAMLETANTGSAGLLAENGVHFGIHQPAMPSAALAACPSPFTEGHAAVRDMEDKGLGQAVTWAEVKELGSLLSKPKEAAEVLVDADTTFAFSAWAMGTQAVAPAAFAIVREVPDRAPVVAASEGPLLLLGSAPSLNASPKKQSSPGLQKQGQGPKDDAGSCGRDEAAVGAVAPQIGEQADNPSTTIISSEPAADSILTTAAQREATSLSLKDDLGTGPSQANDVAKGPKAATPTPVAPSLPPSAAEKPSTRSRRTLLSIPRHASSPRGAVLIQEPMLIAALPALQAQSELPTLRDSCPDRDVPPAANAVAEQIQEATPPTTGSAGMDGPQASAAVEVEAAEPGGIDKEQAASSKAALQAEASPMPAAPHNDEAVSVEDDCAAAGQKEAAAISERRISAEAEAEAAQDVVIMDEETGDTEEETGVVEEKEEEGCTEEEEDEPCLVCGVNEVGDVMVICETCEHVAHLSCAQLKKVPKGDWFCKGCRPSAAAAGPAPKASKSSQAAAPTGRKTRRGAEGAANNGPENSTAAKAQPATTKQAGKTGAAKPAAASKGPRRAQPEGEAEAAPRLRSRGSKDPAKESSKADGKAKAAAPSKAIAKTESRSTRGRDAKLEPAADDNLPAEVARKRAREPQEAAKPGKKAKVAAAPAAGKRTRAQRSGG